MINRLHFFQAGSCTAQEWLGIRGGQIKKKIFPAVVTAMEHPAFGVVLFDTGYSPRIHDATRSFPERLYPLLTPFEIPVLETAVEQLKKLGIDQSDVRFVICSHFHPDHIGGAADFKRAQYICSRQGYQSLCNRSRWENFRAGCLSGLLPGDFAQRTVVLETGQFSQQALSWSDFHTGHDLLGDGSLILVELPGHAVGQLGAVIRGVSGSDYLLASDACWLRRSYQRNAPPPKLVTNLLFDDAKRYLHTLRRIHDFSQRYPAVQIVPGHCAETLAILNAK